jgi:hypothetical protein
MVITSLVGTLILSFGLQDFAGFAPPFYTLGDLPVVSATVRGGAGVTELTIDVLLKSPLKEAEAFLKSNRFRAAGDSVFEYVGKDYRLNIRIHRAETQGRKMTLTYTVGKGRATRSRELTMLLTGARLWRPLPEYGTMLAFSVGDIARVRRLLDKNSQYRVLRKVPVGYTYASSIGSRKYDITCWNVSKDDGTGLLPISPAITVGF